MMERVSDEWLSDMIKLYGGFAEKVILCMKELQARRRTEKEHKNIEANVESVKPLPVKRCKIDGVEQDVKEWTVKQWLQKINEELDEFKVALIRWDDDDADIAITDEAADTITVITSMLEAMLEAMGFDENQRNEAQRRVNQKNRKRGRL